MNNTDLINGKQLEKSLKRTYKHNRCVCITSDGLVNTLVIYETARRLSMDTAIPFIEDSSVYESYEDFINGLINSIQRYLGYIDRLGDETKYNTAQYRVISTIYDYLLGC